MNRLPRQIFASAIAVIALTCQAKAHAHLKAATPPIDGAATPGTSEIELVFSEGINLRFSGASLSGPDGKRVLTGVARLNAENDKILVVPLSGPLSPGLYRVAWHALAIDGHKTTGTYKFTVAP